MVGTYKNVEARLADKLIKELEPRTQNDENTYEIFITEKIAAEYVYKNGETKHEEYEIVRLIIPVTNEGYLRYLDKQRLDRIAKASYIFLGDATDFLYREKENFIAKYIEQEKKNPRLIEIRIDGELYYTKPTKARKGSFFIPFAFDYSITPLKNEKTRRNNNG